MNSRSVRSVVSGWVHPLSAGGCIRCPVRAKRWDKATFVNTASTYSLSHVCISCLCLCVCVLLCLRHCFCLSHVSLSVFLCIYFFVSLSVSVSFSFSFTVTVSASVSLSISVSLCLLLRLSASISVSVSVHVSLSVSFSISHRHLIKQVYSRGLLGSISLVSMLLNTWKEHLLSYHFFQTAKQ